MTIQLTFFSPLARRRTFFGAAAALLVGLAGCSPDDVLTVGDPDVATPQSVADKSALPVLRTGAIGDFSLAFDANQDDNVITYTGLFTDELLNAETFPTRIEVDQRSIQPVNTNLDGVFRTLQRARASARRGADAFAALDPTNVYRLEVLNLEAFTLVLFSEQYCNGVALSTLTSDGTSVYGDNLTGVQLNDRAVAIFDSVVTLAGSNTSTAFATQVNLARVGKARAQLNLNLPTQAAATVASVPTAFAYQFFHSENSTRQNNGIFLTGAINRRFSIADREGGNGLPYRSDNDPRISAPRGTGSASTGFDGTTALYLPAVKYANRSASTTLAGGREARLIEAEAQLRAGSTGAALATLNALRTSVSGLAPLVDAGSTAGNIDLLFKERAYWMWLEGHRLGDMRRLVRQLGRSATSVFPNGTYFKGGSFGTDVNFPLPVSEDNNPNNKGCIDRNP